MERRAESLGSALYFYRERIQRVIDSYMNTKGYGTLGLYLTVTHSGHILVS